MSTGTDHETRRAQEERAYAQAYPEWLASLTPAQRAKLEEKGLGAPDTGRTFQAVGAKNEDGSDPAEWSSASYAPDIAAELDGLAGDLTERFGLTPRQGKLVAAWHLQEVEDESIRYKAFLFQRVCAAFLRPGNVKLRAGALAFAANLAALNGLGTQMSFAATIHVSRSALSKVVKWWQRLLELPPSPHMKSEEACSAYRKAQKQDHWRKKKCPTRQAHLN